MPFPSVDSIYEAEPEGDLLSNICSLQQQLSHLPSDAGDPCWTRVRVGVNVETRTKTQQTEDGGAGTSVKKPEKLRSVARDLISFRAEIRGAPSEG